MRMTSDLFLRRLYRAARLSGAMAASIGLMGCGGDTDSGSATVSTRSAAVAAEPDPTPSPTANSSGDATSSAAADDDFNLFTLDPVSDVHPASGDDPGASSVANHQHVIVEPSSDAHRLFIFLVGTGGNPEGSEEILREGGRRGFHVISLAYRNLKSIDDYCNPYPNSADCAGNVRRDLIVGEKSDGSDGASQLINVSRTDSILGRFDDVLAYLIAHHQDKGWQQFTTGNGIDWSKVVVGGHSQGAGHAAYLGRIRKLARVGLLSGVYDQYTKDGVKTPSAWLDGAKLTDNYCYFGFGNEKEYPNLNGFASLKQSWVALGMTTSGPVTSVDDEGDPPTTVHAPTNNSHRMSTSVWRMKPGINAHVETVNNPAFLPVWSYMMFNKDAC